MVRFLPTRRTSSGAVLLSASVALLACGSDEANSDTESSLVASQVQAYEHETGPRVRVNQLGYLPDGPKRATLITDEDDSVTWQLHDGGDEVVATGRSSPAGEDPSAGLAVHTIDFSDHAEMGSGYRLRADGEESYPFEISEDIYTELRYDALNIYYLQRSGTAIEAIEVDGQLKNQEHERPAGHTSEFVPPWKDIADDDELNRGDRQVPCLPAEGFAWGGVVQYAADDHFGPGGWRCPEDYALNVDGGWYDAGDHGKYMVNSGISVWQLLATYERSQNAEVAVEDALSDETLLIPERGNDVPDILDEARWNLEWMLTMQVPQDTSMTINGEQVDAGGLAHHKLHGIAWTELDTLPHEDPMPRFLHRRDAEPGSDRRPRCSPLSGLRPRVRRGAA